MPGVTEIARTVIHRDFHARKPMTNESVHKEVAVGEKKNILFYPHSHGIYYAFLLPCRIGGIG